MPRDADLYLADILEACRRISDYIRGSDLAAFMLDTRNSDAVLRNLEIIGEAVKKLPPELRAREAEIPWKDIAGLRDNLAHAYFRIDLALIWDVVTSELPELDAAVRRIVASSDS